MGELYANIVTPIKGGTESSRVAYAPLHAKRIKESANPIASLHRRLGPRARSERECA